ncbi:hypothetical protein C8R47DRAFT_1230834 [Mycena vitilis]|nr:hypothetical protein C8R47DRAFT_1230834 [Mycena vitilis]
MGKPKPLVVQPADPSSIRRYRRWSSSKAYNHRNRLVRNEKKRARMAALRAEQKQEPPTMQAARLAAKQEAASTYRARNREVLAHKASLARAAAKARDVAAKTQIARRLQQETERLELLLQDLEPESGEET